MSNPVRFNFADKGSRVLRQWNESRRVARAMAEKSAAFRQFAGAGTTRLTLGLTSSSASINSDLDNSLVVLRARARSLCANYDYGRRFLTLVANNIAGPSGPTLQVRAKQSNGKDLDKAANAAVEWHFANWGGKVSADVRGMQTFPQMLQVVTKAAARDGEAIVKMVRDRSLPYGSALQLLEADRLDDTLNRKLDNGGQIRMGVELDTRLRPVAYWLRTRHPGEIYNLQIGSDQYERVLARDLYHVYKPDRAEQVRGYTWLHAVLLRASHLQGFDEAAVIAARIGASQMGFFTRTGDPTSDDALKQMADAQDATSGALQMDASPGEFRELPPGYDFKGFNPAYPHEAYGDFVRACLRGFASGTDTDYASISNDRSSENYSSIRHGALESRDVWIAGQEWLISSFVYPLYCDWLATAMIGGQITLLESGKALPADKLAKFVDASRFQGRRWAWVDPLKDAEASGELIGLGLESRTAVAAAQGRDFTDILEELTQEKKMLEAAGLPFDVTATLPKPGQSDSTHSSAADRKIEIHNHPAPVTVNQAPTNITFAEGAIRAGDVHVPERQVTLEATIQGGADGAALARSVGELATAVANAPAPRIEVKVPEQPAPVVQVTVAQPVEVKVELPTRESISVVERDNSGQLKTITQTERTVS